MFWQEGGSREQVLGSALRPCLYPAWLPAAGVIGRPFVADFLLAASCGRERPIVESGDTFFFKR
jgi:hypothetical protein